MMKFKYIFFLLIYSTIAFSQNAEKETVILKEDFKFSLKENPEKAKNEYSTATFDKKRVVKFIFESEEPLSFESAKDNIEKTLSKTGNTYSFYISELQDNNVTVMYANYKEMRSTIEIKDSANSVHYYEIIPCLRATLTQKKRKDTETFNRGLYCQKDCKNTDVFLEIQYPEFLNDIQISVENEDKVKGRYSKGKGDYILILNYPGTHKITIKTPGFADKNILIENKKENESYDLILSPFKLNTTVKTENETNPKTTNGPALKLTSNLDCEIYIDGELKTILKAGEENLKKITVSPGKLMLVAKSLDGKDKKTQVISVEKEDLYLTIDLLAQREQRIQSELGMREMKQADSLWNNFKYYKAFTLYKKLSETGNPDAMAMLSFCYYFGYGTLIDLEKSRDLAYRASEKGNVLSDGIIAVILENQNKEDEAKKYFDKVLDNKEKIEESLVCKYLLCKTYSFKENTTEAYKYAKKTAETGFATGQNSLGYMYEYGKGVTKDEVEAVKWYRKSAEQGNATGQVRLGYMYENGQGVTKDEVEALKWYRKAAEQGDALGQSELGVMYVIGKGVTKDEVKAVKWFKKAAEQGNARGQISLGYMYADGLGVTKDEVEAVKWYRKAAEQGYALGQSYLGYMYANGKGVTKDEVEAVKWYRKAAEQGNANAQYNLGRKYSNGQGVTKDEVEAVKWYRKSAEQGNATGQNNLGYMYANGQGVTKDEVEAVKWYRKSAEQGAANAQNNLGYMYEYGKGVTKDEVEAVKWFKKAAEQGSNNGQAWLGFMYENGKGVTKDLAEAVKWYRKAAEQGDEYAKNNLKRLGY